MKKSIIELEAYRDRDNQASLFQTDYQLKAYYRARSGGAGHEAKLFFDNTLERRAASQIRKETQSLPMYFNEEIKTTDNANDYYDENMKRRKSRSEPRTLFEARLEDEVINLIGLYLCA